MATTATAITATSAAAARSERRQFQDVFEAAIPFVVTLEDDTLAAQLASQVDVTVTGAELGDFVLLGFGQDITTAVITAQVTAANTVTVTVFNTENSDAYTALATPTEARGIVLKTADQIWSAPSAY